MLLRIGPSSDQIRSAGVNRHTKARTRSSLANRVTVWTVVATARNVGETSCCSFMRGHLEPDSAKIRSEEHTSELQSLTNLVCRLLLEKKKKSTISTVWLSDVNH